MTRIILAFIAFCVIYGGIHAQEPATQTPPAVPSVTVSESLEQMTYITEARPAPDARFYVYLCSASWCRPCRVIMPQIVERYPEIKAAGGEVVLMCYDSTPETGQAYVKKYNAGFPTIMAGSLAESRQTPLGFVAPRGIPSAIIVTPEGKVIYKGYAGALIHWKSIIEK